MVQIIKMPHWEPFQNSLRKWIEQNVLKWSILRDDDHLEIYRLKVYSEQAGLLAYIDNANVLEGSIVITAFHPLVAENLSGLSDSYLSTHNIAGQIKIRIYLVDWELYRFYPISYFEPSGQYEEEDD